MDFEPAFALATAICENVVRPPALKISAAPDRDVLNVREIEHAIDPAATTPFWRSNIPVGMIIKRNENNRLRDSTKPKRAQIMKIARAIEDERRELRIELAVKFFD